jgi:predicted amidohydrolase YtcJ
MSRILYRGGPVYSPVPGASALLVDGGQVAWVGSDAAAAGLGEPDVVVDLDGGWLAPAFVDAHVHVVAAGLAMTGLELSDASSLSAVLRTVAEAAAGAPADALIWGTGWDETRWGSGGPCRPPAPPELDRAAGGRPVYLARTDVHSAAASTGLLRAAGLEAGAAPVTGAAHHTLRRAARRLLTAAQQQAAADAFFASAVRLGIAMVHECSGPHIGDPQELAAVRRAAGAAGIDLAAFWGESGTAGVSRARGYGAEPGGDIFVDGSLGSRTAAISIRYLDAPADPAPAAGAGCGSLLLGPAEIAGHLIAATRAGAQAGFHVIGDAAISAAIEGIERAAQAVGRGPLAASRHRLEHLEMCDAAQAAVLARYGIIASVQPAFDARWGGSDGMYATRLGTDRAAAMNDFAGLAAAGVPLAFGSDAPVTPLDPWGALRAAVAPTTPAHALSARAAFAAHTRGGHRAARRDNGGVLRPGADATFAVWLDAGELSVGGPDEQVCAWSTDPRAGTPGLPDLTRAAPRCVATVVRGKAVHDAGLLAVRHRWTRDCWPSGADEG